MTCPSLRLFCLSISATTCSKEAECTKVDVNAECVSTNCACKNAFKESGSACLAIGTFIAFC